MMTLLVWLHRPQLILILMFYVGISFISHGQSKESMASLLDSCRVLRKQGGFEEAFDLASKIELAAKMAGDTACLIRVNKEFGIIYVMIGKKVESKLRFREQLRYSFAIDDNVSKASGFNNLGGAFLNSNEVDSALVYFIKSMELKKEIGDDKGYAIASTNLSSVYKRMGLREEAEILSRNTIITLASLDDLGPYYTSLVNYAGLCIDYDEYHIADSLLKMVINHSDQGLYFEQYLQALENFSISLYNRTEFRTAYDSLESLNIQKDIFIGDKTHARIQVLEIKHARAEKQLEIDRSELLAEKQKSKILFLLVGLILALAGALLWVVNVRKNSRERTRILNQSYEKETKRVTDLVWREIALSIDGKDSSFASGKGMSKESLFGAMGALEYLRNQQKNPFLQISLNRALRDMFVPREGTSIEVKCELADIDVDKEFRVTVFRIIEALFKNCLDSIRSGQLRISIRADDNKMDVEFDVPGELLEKSALYLAAGARLHEIKGKMKIRSGNAGMLLDVTIPLPKATQPS
ncbi:MAG: tetratricopeptide (TPR) repeat protein [Litorivivens sp.]|jgi:tetratricopeptide (TPR) repeat protein